MFRVFAIITLKGLTFMKKRTKRLLTLILTSLILLMSVNFSLAAEIVTPTFGIENPTLYNSSQINVDLEKHFNPEEFVNYLVEQLKLVDGDSSIIAKIDIKQFAIPYSSEMTTALQNLIWYNSPELFRIAGMAIDYYPNDIFYQIRFYSYCTKEEYIKMLNEMQASAENLVTDVKGNDNLSKVEKALILHDRLALLCEYDYDNLQNNSVPYTSYNAYGVLVLNDAVCQGYALAYDYLLEQVGIKADYCCSNTLNHAWNIVYINNIPYHVDVTWDDPVWDLPGRVQHVNFLRSTEGIKATGHNATDFTTTPSDTTYDNYYWQNSNTAFQLINDEIYFFNTNEKNLYKLNNENGEDAEVLLEIPYNWATSATSFYGTSFVNLISDGEYLYYSVPNAVYKYDTETLTAEEFYKPDLSELESYNFIYGIKAKDCELTCFVNEKYEYTSKYKETPTEHYFSITNHSSGEWVTTKEPTTELPGEKQKLCKNCKTILETQETPKLNLTIITPLENTTLDEENNVIFSNIEICQNISQLCKTQSDMVCEISPSTVIEGTNFIGTGSVVTLYKNDEKIAEYKIIINGDLNGDSVCDVLDVALTEICIYNKTPSAIECYAANGMAINEIDINSLQYVVNTALG